MGEPGPAPGVAAPRTQRDSGHGGRTPAPEAASEPACGSPPAALKEERTRIEEEEDGKEQAGGENGKEKV